MVAYVTNHADERIRKRLGVPRSAVQKLAQEALDRGARHGDFSGRFKRYLDGIFIQEKSADNLRVHSGHVFLFAGEDLVTAWRVPGNFHAAALKAQRKHTTDA